MAFIEDFPVVKNGEAALEARLICDIIVWMKRQTVISRKNAGRPLQEKASRSWCAFNRICSRSLKLGEPTKRIDLRALKPSVGLLSKP